MSRALLSAMSGFLTSARADLSCLEKDIANLFRAHSVPAHLASPLHHVRPPSLALWKEHHVRPSSRTSMHAMYHVAIVPLLKIRQTNRPSLRAKIKY